MVRAGTCARFFARRCWLGVAGLGAHGLRGHRVVVASRVSPRRATYFLLLRQKKVSKEKANRSPVRFAVPCAARAWRGRAKLALGSDNAALIRQPLRCSARSHGYLKAKVLLLNSKGGATQVFKEEQVLKRNCFSLRTASCDRVKTRARSMCSKA